VAWNFSSRSFFLFFLSDRYIFLSFFLIGISFFLTGISFFLIKQIDEPQKPSGTTPAFPLPEQHIMFFEESDTLQKDFGDAVTQLFGMDDGLVTQLPLETVLLLGGSAVTAAKSQAAKACVQKAEELAAKYALNDTVPELIQDTMSVRKMTECLDGMIHDVMTDIDKGTGQHRPFAKQILLSCIQSVEVLCRIPKTEFKPILAREVFNPMPAREVGSKGLIDVLTCTERYIYIFLSDRYISFFFSDRFIFLPKVPSSPLLPNGTLLKSSISCVTMRMPPTRIPPTTPRTRSWQVHRHWVQGC
jgi:hypothetical protein